MESPSFVSRKAVSPELSDTVRDLDAKGPVREKCSIETEKMVGEAVGKADEIVKKAKEDALRIIKQARAEAEESYHDAYEKGYGEGLKTAKKENYENEKILVDQLQNLMERLSSEKQKAKDEVNAEALDFAFELAEKITDIEIDRNDKAFVNICKKAVSHVEEAKSAVLRVGPREYAIASRYGSEIKKALSGLPNLQIQLDENRTGSCVLETDTGLVDASVKAQLSRARQLIEENN